LQYGNHITGPAPYMHILNGGYRNFELDLFLMKFDTRRNPFSYRKRQMTTSTLPLVSENAVLSSLAAFVAKLVKPAVAPSVRTAGDQSLMGLYRLAASGDSVSPAVASALAKRAAH
jgi:hypothetical protein